MLHAGEKQKLTVNRLSPYGAYLCDEEQNEVLLPNRYITADTIVGSTLEVFLSFDSEDRLVASTDMPYILKGEVALLQVIDVNDFGAFLDWGLPKDLFLPLANQRRRLKAGEFCLVTIYQDNVSGRIVATAKLNKFVNNLEIVVQPKEKVDIIIAEKNDLGYRVVVNNRNWGMLYNNQIFLSDIRIGDIFTGYVSRITPDHRIDILLQPMGKELPEEAASTILSALKENGGTLPLGDDSSPEEIYRQLEMSKKMFKRGVGHLWKAGQIELGETEIRLK